MFSLAYFKLHLIYYKEYILRTQSDIQGYSALLIRLNVVKSY